MDVGASSGIDPCGLRARIGAGRSADSITAPETAKLEWHYTPPHGNWLNRAECELSILARQCLNRCFPEQAQVAVEVEAWYRYRNAQAQPVKWRCTTADARIKLRHLYPSFWSHPSARETDCPGPRRQAGCVGGEDKHPYPLPISKAIHTYCHGTS